jgi:hypothetical protein
VIRSLTDEDLKVQLDQLRALRDRLYQESFHLGPGPRGDHLEECARYLSGACASLGKAVKHLGEP